MFHETHLVEAASVLFGLTFGVALVMLLHGARRIRYRRRRDSAIHAVRRDVVRVLARPELDQDLAKRLRTLPLRVRLRLFVEIGRNLHGVEADRLADLARLVGLLRLADDWCASRHWWRRLHGVRLFRSVGGGHGIVPGLLQDGHPLVRAEAAMWLAEHPSPDAARHLVRLLGMTSLVDRAATIEALGRLGAPAADEILHVLTAVGAEGVSAALEASLAVADARFGKVALRFVAHPDAGVRRRAALLLGTQGAEAAPVLQDLLSDPVAEVRTAAAEALGRSGAWDAAAALHRLLEDPIPSVRRAGALALRRLGSPGVVVLRRVADGDSAAARLARHVLDLPPVAVGVSA